MDVLTLYCPTFNSTLLAAQYKDEPVSWFQKKIRGDTAVLIDHISKEMNELNLIRCQKIPKRPGADWRDLPDEKVHLSANFTRWSVYLTGIHIGDFIG